MIGRKVVCAVQIYLNASECCEVFGDDRLGLYNERHEGPIGYEFVDVASVQYEHIEPRLHDVRDFDQLRFPYKFALAAAFDTG